MTDTQAVRMVPEDQVRELAMQLAKSIAGLGYPVGLGVAPPEDVCMKAAQAIFDIYPLAAAPSVQPDSWQDISTAPKDGTLILCLYPHRHGHNRYSLRYWSTGDWPSSGRSEGWCDQYRQLRRDDPTHWTPLLAALPVQKEEG